MRVFVPGEIIRHNLDLNAGGFFSVTDTKENENQTSQHQTQ